MKGKRLVCLFFGFLLTLASLGSTVNAQHVGDYERGPNYEVTRNPDGTVTWSSAPLAIFDGSRWVPHIYGYDEAKKCHRVQTALIAGELYESGVSTFYDPTVTEQRVKSEAWSLEVYDGKAWKPATLNTPISFSVSTSSEGVYITATRTTSKPSGVFSVLYCYVTGGPLKHTVTWESNEVNEQTVRVVQKWDLAGSITKVKIESGETSNSGFYDYAWFQFGNDTHPYLVFEDQTSMVEYLEPTEIDFEGKKATFRFSGWTLAQGQKLEIDPYTVTWQVEASSDDCEVTGSDIFLLLHLSIGNVTLAGPYDIGMRWTNVTVPQYADVTSAYIKFYSWSDKSGTSVLTNITGEAKGNPATFSTYADFVARNRTSAVVAWDSLPAWTMFDPYTTPNIGPIVQEIVNRTDWSSGNTLAFFVEDDGSSDGAYREACSWDDYPSLAPTLEITYLPTTVTCGPFTITSTSGIDNPDWDDVNRILSFETSGNVTVDVGDWGMPLRVETDNTLFLDWTYNATAKRVTLTNVAS